jgi:hypothetical protein
MASVRGRTAEQSRLARTAIEVDDVARMVVPGWRVVDVEADEVDELSCRARPRDETV